MDIIDFEKEAKKLRTLLTEFIRLLEQNQRIPSGERHKPLLELLIYRSIDYDAEMMIREIQNRNWDSIAPLLKDILKKQDAAMRI